MSTISKSSLLFLKDLAANNNRPWFAEQKDRYEEVKKESKAFLSELEAEMSKVDKIEKTKLFRIYRDVRFSKDKTPYNAHISMSMSREKPYLRGGYYLRIKPGETILAVGFWNPNSSDLKLIRGNIDLDPQSFREAISAPSILEHYGHMQGDTVKSAPKGYSKEHPAIDLLRHKQFLFSKEYSDAAVTQNNFLPKVVADYQAVRPFFDYMSDILSHNLNGEPLY